MARICLEGMQFYAHHGCFEEERTVGAHFIVDCDLGTALFDAAREDNLEKTIDYQKVYQIVKEEMEIPSALLENVAYRILKSFHHHFPMMKRGQVCVYKMNPPLSGKVDKVGVKVSSGDIYDIKKNNRHEK